MSDPFRGGDQGTTIRRGNSDAHRSMFFKYIYAPIHTSGVLLPDASVLFQAWTLLNRQFFEGKLAPLAIHWSTRLTASLGVFVCSRNAIMIATGKGLSSPSRCIRLSQPLFHSLCHDPTKAARELRATLAHEMIHQWQFDRLHRRPDHGRTFRTMMEAMNREGLHISIYHACTEAVAMHTRYCWACIQCGQRYERQRRTINPRRHRCGRCRGSLKLMCDEDRTNRSSINSSDVLPAQLPLPLLSR